MRYIRTSNNYVEFIEADKDEQILSVRGFQFGELYFQIKNNKVTFYLNDQENPWRNDVWTLNIPFELDGVLYDNEDDASEALQSIMNDSFQDQLDELREDLAEETARAISAETEIATNLENLDEKVDDEIERAKAAESALTDALNAEIGRSVAKDAEHDALISGLTNGLDNEIQRAMSAETVLHNEILAEEARALAAESALTDDLANEITRSTAKDVEHDAQISALTNSLNNEITRATNAENSLRTDLNNEVSARTASDNTQNQRLTALEVGKADANNVYTKAESDAKYATKEYVSGNTYTKAEITTMLADKADKVNAVSTALYNSQSKTIDLKNIYGNVVASIDARDFIKDGMVDNVVISNNNLVITFNTDAGKEDIVVPLTDIFDPSNYYNKSEIDTIVNNIESGITQDLTNYYTKDEVDASQLVQDNKIDAISGKVDTISGDVITLSGDVQTLSGKVDTISGDVITLSGEVQTISGKVDTISGDVQTISGKVDSVKTYVAGRAINITTGATADTISFNLPIWAGQGSSSIIENYSDNRAKVQYSHAEGYSTEANKRGTHAEGWITKANGDFGSHSEGYGTNASGKSSHAEGYSTVAAGDYSHAEGFNTLTSSLNEAEHACGYYNISRVNSVVSNPFGHSGDTLFSVGNGNYNSETSATTRHNAFEIRQNGDIYISDTNASGEYYQKPMIKLQDHLGGGGGGVTPTEVQEMIDNSLVDYQKELSAGTNVQINNNVISATDTTYSAGDNITISNQNVISTVTKFWCGDETAYNQIAIKDPNTIYLIHS